MKIEDCISVIDNCSGFDDVSTSVGEAWDRIKTELTSTANGNISFDLGSLPSTTFVCITGLNTITDNLSGIPDNPTTIYIGYIPQHNRGNQQ